MRPGAYSTKKSRMAAARGGRDVESVNWFNLNCMKGMCIDINGGWNTNLITVTTVDTDHGVRVVNGFEHILMMCGIAFFEFPAQHKGVLQTKAFTNRSISDFVRGNVHDCLKKMCTEYNTFMVQNFAHAKLEFKDDKCVKPDECTCEVCLPLKTFMNTQVVHCSLGQVRLY